MESSFRGSDTCLFRAGSKFALNCRLGVDHVPSKTWTPFRLAKEVGVFVHPKWPKCCIKCVEPLADLDTGTIVLDRDDSHDVGGVFGVRIVGVLIGKHEAGVCNLQTDSSQVPCYHDRSLRERGEDI